MPRVTDFSDNFNRADSTVLGANWDGGYTLVGGTIGTANLQIVGNLVEASTSATVNINSVNAVTLANDQWSQVTLTRLDQTPDANDYSVSVFVRLHAPGVGQFSGYSAKVAWNNPSSGLKLTTIQRWDDATGDTDIGTSDTTTVWADGDTLSLEAIGSTLTLFRNGSLLLTAADTVYSSGRAGLEMFLGTFISTIAQVDDFSCGHFSAASTGGCIISLLGTTL